ncbi:hypothetical protein NPIL_635821 [Nephila pilipes]|uniref:Uncharacterized protein n=1 Tax=Nephila pilipes TaxID=299642 RepID=A0A8X6JS01_NEPPI|nr:hypothetical protein NPIL_635821 [Nephila pilipes]
MIFCPMGQEPLHFGTDPGPSPTVQLQFLFYQSDLRTRIHKFNLSGFVSLDSVTLGIVPTASCLKLLGMEKGSGHSGKRTTAKNELRRISNASTPIYPMRT